VKGCTVQQCNAWETSESRGAAIEGIIITVVLVHAAIEGVHKVMMKIGSNECAVGFYH
jgi:hypothetical protein